ncbi:HlyD family type I secretion periplasmic adaptor subunit [Stutzerimonas kirkiae]|uniref:Membrane fusion protein (MFP) family protein n=1 Tax=Stutzerimonas kirkiae TaxID=2211392 RepID=A0A4Q9RDL1_9GAMM|nr:HlyD family type I secretion periplasmic adaptor subunit [Stutzerimonas kirkiae]TBU98087.1 HlyD family type I secretion periplasmic adaptor subunit [Stutzerimonas kirkiae]TBV02892.1 HlyD family type I secretion periplasmic adaptor subunit [Stutzerimonas kirkiae]TBV09157.1 HlyD family type I secretion periplasmic adaptor subunit [Stutzerimonas kirkiae]TBV11138.1 HlyD family type I secretion periplasmic adaptor subunit [Stutzerimonas kirkiae]
MSQQKAPDVTAKPAEQQAFEHLERLSGAGAFGRSLVDRLFRPLFAGFRNGSARWEQDAELALERQKVLRARGLLYSIAAIFAVLLLWSALTRIDEVTRGEGKIIPSRQLQIVQSVDGGVVEDVFVEEGDAVSRGDVLVRIDPTRFVASFQEGSVRVFALRAKVERLKALVDDLPYQPERPAQLSADQSVVLEQEHSYYLESRKELEQKLSIAREQRAQRQQELSEVRARLHAAEQAYRMSSQELQVTRPLLRSGAVSEIDILRLERDQASADGERRQAAARARQIEAGIQEADARLREVELTTRNLWRSELSEASSQLNSLDKNVDGLADRVKFSEIRSPVNGTIQRVLFNTIGGVVQPGHAVIEIVPNDDRLLVEARVAPKDIAFLRPGLPATIKLHAYDFSIYGGLEAQLQHISADTITDERDNTFYLVRAVTTDAESAQRLAVIPGMTAQLDIITGKKSILAYLLKPILRAKANALSER